MICIDKYSDLISYINVDVHNSNGSVGPEGYKYFLNAVGLFPRLRELPVALNLRTFTSFSSIFLIERWTDGLRFILCVISKISLYSSLCNIQVSVKTRNNWRKRPNFRSMLQSFLFKRENIAYTGYTEFSKRNEAIKLVWM